MQNTRRAVFFDRDGVVNRRRFDDYVKSWDEFEFLPGIFDVLPRVRRAGYQAILVTNQRGIARGLMSEASLADVHARMQDQLEQTTGTAFDAIYFCPHERDAGCACRKPLPGMLSDAAREHDLDLSRSWMIGDSESDVIAGRAAGCRSILIALDDTTTTADFVAPTLGDAWSAIENFDRA